MSQGFAERLKQREFSQAQLAQAVGAHQNHIGRYERGESQPSADALRRLAAVLGVSTDYLIEGTCDEAAKALGKSFLDAFLFKCKVEGLSATERR